MKKIYISGAISSRPIHEAEAHFKAAQLRLLVIGYDCINPMEISPYSQEKTWEDYMRNDIKHLMDCQAIYMLRGWWKSRGARVEWWLAKKLGMEVIYEK